MSNVIKQSRQLSVQLQRSAAVPVLEVVRGENPSLVPSDEQAILPPADCELLIEEARREAAEIRESALAERKKLLEEAQTRTQAGYQKALADAHSEGYQSGFEQGQRDGREALEQAVSEARDVVCAAKQHWENRLRSARQLICELTEEAVRVLLHRELELAPADIETMVADLLDELVERTGVEVRVHPDDYQRITQEENLPTGPFGGLPVTVLPDLAMEAGSCEVRTPNGRVDASISTRLELLSDVIVRVVEEEDDNEPARQGVTGVPIS